MKRFRKWLRVMTLFVLDAMAAVVLFATLQVLYRFEEAGVDQIMGMDIFRLYDETLSTHRLTLVLLVGSVMVILFWSRHIIESAHENKELLKRILETAADGIYFVDRRGRMMYANRATEEMLGMTRDEIAKRTYNDIYWNSTTLDGKPFPEEDQPFVRVMRTGAPVHGVEQVVQKPDGHCLIVSINATALRDDDGEIVGEIGGMTDITERKRAEAQLKVSEERYKNIVENANDIIYRTDVDGRFVFYNSTATRLLKYSADELIGRYYLELIHPDYRTETRKFYLAQLTQGIPSTYREIAVIGRDGTEFWLGQHVQTLTEGGRVVGFQSVARDITERKRTEERLRLAEEKYRSIFENAVIGIYQTTRDGKWLTANSALARMLGYDSPQELMEEMPDLNQVFYVGPDRRAEFVRLVDERDIVWGFESEVYRKDGSIIWISENARAIRNAAGSRIGFEGTTVDITERKQVERLKSEFVSVVSHELRTPLTSIRGSLGLIMGGAAGNVSPNAQALVEIAHTNSERLVLLVNDILDIDKMESGTMAFDNRPIEIMPLLEQAIEANAGYAHEYGVILSLKNSLPGIQVNADWGRLTQVVTNLISNAVKFSPRGESVEIAVMRRKSNVRVAVIDHGSGIPEQFQSRVFQKFAQADSSTTRHHGGTGLGLSISKAIIEKLGGRIDFETRENVGTIFFFDLPEWRAPIVSPAPAPARFLVCEDDRDTSTLLQRLLEEARYAADIAASAAQAK